MKRKIVALLATLGLAALSLVAASPASAAGTSQALLVPGNCSADRVCFYQESQGRGGVNLVNAEYCQNFPASWNDTVTSIYNNYPGHLIALFMDSNCPPGLDGKPDKWLEAYDEVQLNREWSDYYNDEFSSIKVYNCNNTALC